MEYDWEFLTLGLKDVYELLWKSLQSGTGSNMNFCIQHCMKSWDYIQEDSFQGNGKN